ncbi:MAG TPA: serine/threonine-protein kinase [Solirubrobacteraceae bacterium]|nr:serine/threonine-protein kinase [Solirubrobacteraceae bacterium]
MATRGQPGADSTKALNLPERYRARRHLATGGMASVWCADDLVLGRTVAIKVLAERFEHDDMAVRRFKREARAAARVSTHAHVVTIFDVGDLEPEAPGASAGRAFIVMEYLAGGTVADAIRVGAVRRQEAVRWIREAASALDHAHVRGIVHRDIKPANFLLNRSRVLHVADFGIARLVSEDTITTAGELFGTAAYLSPEQALGREATGASDRYALAVAAFELLAGERPFGAQHFAAQARQHIEEPPPYASERDRTLPPAVDAVLIRGMAKQPDERFDSAGEFIDALETALSGGIPVTARELTQHRRPERTPGRYLGAAAAAARSRAGGVGSRPGPGASAPVAPPTTSRSAARTAGAGRRPPGGPPPWTPADSLQRGRSSHRGGRLVALAALLVAVIGVGALAIAGLGGSHKPAGTAAKTRRTATTATHAHHAARKPQTVASDKSPAASTTSPSASTPTTATQAPPQSAETLQDTGYQEMLAGNYPVAIATLRKAVSAASPGSLTYAYGLYNLGRSLLLSGDAAGAVPVLEQRMKIPNQTDVVLATLNRALVAAGQQPLPEPSAPPAPQTPPGHAKHRGGSGGAGLGGPPGHDKGAEHTSFVD